MVLRFRLKRRFCFYKSFITFIAIVILLLIYFEIFGATDHNIQKERKIHCPHEEPIDVVYTWVNGSDPVFWKNLNNFVKRKNYSIDSSKQRFDDKYELKFSLRSLEKYAPWVNHVYIVTNGQIPYWLNLDYEKVSIITHEEIFKDTFNLPSFSSPAIECNLHRIPGLSKRFIYFNDDIFLGGPTYLEDFYAPNKGFLIYLAWPVPQCALSCPWMYVADGQCDKECFKPECQMDGGDCNINEQEGTTQEIVTDKREYLRRYEDLKKKMLADTVQRVRANFYKTFLNKLLPQKTKSNITILTTQISVDKPKRINFLYKILNNTNNLTEFVNEHNRVVLKNDKLKRGRLKKLRRHNKHNKTFIERLHPSINVDAYSASLQHTNRVFNKNYGFNSRKVPSHAPILIDREIMEDLQQEFAKEFDITERNRIRREDDMQFSFSYYYFIISEKIQRDMGDIFNEIDTDLSSTWSDREIRTLLTKIYELPLSYAVVDHFEALLLNCSISGEFPEIATPSFERYIDSKLPAITKDLVTKCPPLEDILMQRFGLSSKYTYEIVQNSESKYVAFKMLNSNISDVVSNLDDIRNNRKKFVCLNDNLDETKESENELVRAILYDFYVSLFPLPSKFELSEDFRNKFMYISELNEWKHYHYNIRVCTYFFLFMLLCFMFYNLCKKKCCQITNKLCC